MQDFKDTGEMENENLHVFIRNNKCAQIYDKISKQFKVSMENIVSSYSPFGLQSNFDDYSIVANDLYNIALYTRAKTIVYVQNSDLAKNLHLLRFLL